MIDTNVFIYAILQDSEFHQQARDFLAKLERWIVPSIVIYELYWFFRAEGYDKEQIEKVVKSIIDSQRSRIAGDSGGFTKRALELTKNPTRFNDMVILAVAEKYRKLATYDRRLRKDAENLGIEVAKELNKKLKYY